MGIIRFPDPGKRHSRHRDEFVDTDYGSKSMEGPLQSEGEMGYEDRQKLTGKPVEPRVRRRKKKRKHRRRRQSAVKIIAQSLNTSDGVLDELAASLSPTEIIARSVRSDTGTPGDLQDQLTTALESITQPWGEVAPEKKHAPPRPQEAEPFWHVWLEHRDYLRRLTMRLMENNMEEAEDALSHAMLKASQKYDECANTLHTPLAWLTTIVHNTCLDHQRSFKNQKQWMTESNLDRVVEPKPAASAASEPSPEEHVSMPRSSRTWNTSFSASRAHCESRS